MVACGLPGVWTSVAQDMQPPSRAAVETRPHNAIRHNELSHSQIRLEVREFSIGVQMVQEPSRAAVETRPHNAIRHNEIRHSEIRRHVRDVARGVQLVQEVRPAGVANISAPLVINVLRVDLKQPGVRVEAALAGDKVWGDDPTEGRETVSHIVSRRRAVAAVNAGFFPFNGTPEGAHVQAGELVTEPNRRATLLLGAGLARFVHLNWSGTVRATTGATTKLNGLNGRPGAKDDLLLYSPIFHSQTLKPGDTERPRFEVVVGGVGQLRAGRDLTGIVRQTNEGGATPLAPDTVVLSGAGAGADWLRAHAQPGARLTVRLDIGLRAVTASAERAPDEPSQPLDPKLWHDAVAGASQLLRDGRVVITAEEEGIGGAFITTRHPRTAVGLTRRGELLLVTVDGRQPTLSRGAALNELAWIMMSYGAWDAINLDGGGSTAMAVRGGIVNSPSGGAERPVANMLLVFAPPLPIALNAPGVPPFALSPQAQNRSAPLSAPQVEETVPFLLRDGAGRDAGSHHSTIWGTLGGIGFVEQNGLFRAMKAGSGTVRATSSGHTVVVPLTVAPAKNAPVIPPVPPASTAPTAPTIAAPAASH